MAVLLGDIVDARVGRWERWVVSGFDQRDGIDRVKIIRRYGSVYQHNTKDVDDLVPVERPVFTPGEAVLVDGMKAVFMSRDGIRARAMLAPQRWAIADNEIMDVGPAVAAINYVTLVLENRWTERPNKESDPWQ